MPRKDAHAMGEPLMSLTGRFPVSVVARIDAHAEAMRCAMPGLSIGRTDVLRSLVVQALDALYAPIAGAVTDTVTDTTVTDTAQLRRRLRQEFEAFLDSRSPLIQAILHPQPVTDTVTDTQSQPDEAAAVEPEPELPRQSDDQSDDHEDRPRARRVAIPQDDELEDMPLVPTAAAPAETVKTARPTAAAKPKAKAARQRAVTDTVTDTETPQPQAPNAQRRKRLPVTY